MIMQHANNFKTFFLLLDTDDKSQNIVYGYKCVDFDSKSYLCAKMRQMKLTKIAF